MAEKLQFVQFNSFVDASFWWKLTESKLNVYQLDESVRTFNAYYVNSDSEGLPCRMTVDFTSLDIDKPLPSNNFLCHGRLLLKNTIENFRCIDKKALLAEIGSLIWSDIKSGAIFDDLSKLSQSCLLCFIDIKKYRYFYWFAYPAVSYPFEISLLDLPKRLNEAFSANDIQLIQQVCIEHGQKSNCGFFLIQRTDEHQFQLLSMDSLKDLSLDDTKVMLCFCDSSTDVIHPGWSLRNLLALWAYYRKGRSVKILCWRQRYATGRLECEHSLVLNVCYVKSEDVDDQNLSYFGWEKNEKGQVAPRFVDLSSSMDPIKIADSAVSLNLQLMRWRLVPELNLDVIKDVKCLLIGSGTLGSNVARCLLGWGVRKITFVDNSKVSFSNPVRQSLFQFDDCLNGGKWKAEVAAEALKRLLPNIDSVGVRLTVPMPGHFVSEKDSEEIKSAVDKLVELISGHDIVFLLLDTREGRWLPTLLSTINSKLTFSVALGFDSFLVVRHGFGLEPENDSTISLSSKLISGDRLGCYFCSDVTAPANSTNDRTLDQQCTVTRPGVSMVAAALAVELMTSLLQHPLQAFAPSEVGEQTSSTNHSCLGTTPHQIRGFVGRFDQFTPTVQRFNKCIACSRLICDEYHRRGFDFLLSVFNNPLVLERLTGLDDLQKNTESAEVWELSDDESVVSST